MDEIRCDETSYLIWKWSPSGKAGTSRRENAIRWGSSLRVKEGSVAVFLNSYDGGRQDFIEGPFDGIVETGNFPVLAGLIGKLYDGGTPFQAEIYFINLVQSLQVRFGVPYFDVFDSKYPEFGVPVAVRGTVTFGIKDYRKFVSLHGLNGFDIEQFQARIRSSITRQVKGAVAGASKSYDIPIIQVESKIPEISSVIEEMIRERLDEDFGVNVVAFDIEAIEVNKSCDGYRQLMEITRDITIATTRARAEAEVKDIADMQRINAENAEDLLRIQREEGQYRQRMQTRERYLEAFKVTSQADVALAGAEALGRLGETGGSCINGNGGMNPAGIMAGLSMGGAVAQGLSSAMGGMTKATTQPEQTPPPIPVEMYHVVLGGQVRGPFNMSELASLHASGQLTEQSYVWRDGMADWVHAGSVAGLASLFSKGNHQTPPPAPHDV